MAPYSCRRGVSDRGYRNVTAIRWSQVPGPVRATLVVMRDVLVQDRPEVPWPGDRIRSVTSARAVRTQRSA